MPVLRGDITSLNNKNSRRSELFLQFQSIALCLVPTFFFQLPIHPSERTWHSVQEPSSQERKSLDLGTQSLRYPQRSHLPKEKFPFAAPHFAEEMGLRAMEFPHTPLWNCLLIDIGTTVTVDGFLDQQVATSAILALPHPDSPGQEAFRWISRSVNSPSPENTAIVQIGYLTGKNSDVALRLLEKIS